MAVLMQRARLRYVAGKYQHLDNNARFRPYSAERFTNILHEWISSRSIHIPLFQGPRVIELLKRNLSFESLLFVSQGVVMGSMPVVEK